MLFRGMNAVFRSQIKVKHLRVDSNTIMFARQKFLACTDFFLLYELTSILGSM